MRLLSIISCLIVFILSCSSAVAKDSLVILSRALKDDNIERTSDKLFYDTFSHALKDEFTTTFQWTNHARLIRRLESDEAVCSYNIIKTPQREKLFEFSHIPTSMHIQRKIYGDKETLKNRPETVSVSKLLAQYKTFGAVSSVSYEQLDKMFSNYHDQVVSLHGADSFTQLAQLLLHKRVNLIVNYDSVMKTLLTNEQLATLDSRKIAEYPEFVTGHFVCSRPPKGSKALDIINAYMSTPQMYNFIKKTHFSAFDKQTATNMLSEFKNKYNLSPSESIY